MVLPEHKTFRPRGGKTAISEIIEERNRLRADLDEAAGLLRRTRHYIGTTSGEVNEDSKAVDAFLAKREKADG